MPIAAVALSATWLLTALVLRVALQVRRTGDTGLRVDTASPRSPAWWATRAFVAGLTVVAAMPVLVAAGVTGAATGPPLVRWGGLFVAMAGVVGTFAAQLGMGASWRIGVDQSERTALVTGGIFRWVRNPIFTAMIGTAGGLTLMVPTVLGAAAWCLVVAAVEAQVRLVEEPYLRAMHGDEYRCYCRSVGRFVPLLGRVR
jgi:protein-S-isoprenylcysteine O-methyltransferase Ste14